jgi:hypothetical protein
MRASFIAVAFCLIAWPSAGQAAFKTCQDAWNYGSNAGKLYAGITYNTLACGNNAREVTREEAELGLAHTMSGFSARDAETDAHLLCMYSGLYTGLLQRASVEYEECPTRGFACLRQVTVGQYAVAVLAALYDALALPVLLTPQDVADNLALLDVELLGDPVCGRCDGCEAAIWEFIEANELDVDEGLVEQLVVSTCVCSDLND